VIREAADFATTLRTVLYGQSASVCGEVMKLTDLDEATRIFNTAVDRMLAPITLGLKCARHQTAANEKQVS